MGWHSMAADNFRNLLSAPWLPVIHRSGMRSTIRPSEIALGIDIDPIVSIAWPRADFCGAALEFLIGLFYTCAAPGGDEEWEEWWLNPPSPEKLATKLAPFAEAFNLRGDGPLFMQDRGSLGDELVPVGSLLIDQPGANTEKNNTDLFVKRGQVGVMAASTAAMALFTLQSTAPAGGAGHRTSMRGGGPLTTLVLPEDEPTLWQIVWMNVVQIFEPNKYGLPQDAMEKVFPWLAPTRVSDKSGVATTPQDVHPAQCFWGMPRRIGLDFERNDGQVACDITGEVEDFIVRGYRTRPFGANYQEFIHPLTPYYRVKKGDAELLPTHPQPGGIAYRHWLSYVQNSDTRQPAKCIKEAERRLKELKNTSGKPRLRMFGYDMDNAKAREFAEAEMPLLLVPDDISEEFGTFVECLVGGAVEAVSILSGMIGTARVGRKSSGQPIREIFFRNTEQAFFETVSSSLKEIAKKPGDIETRLKLLDRWRSKTLFSEALYLFDREVPVNGIVSASDPKLIQAAVNARRTLVLSLNGFGASGRRLFAALGMR